MAVSTNPTERAIAEEVAALASLTHQELRIAWRHYYKQYPPKFLNRDLIELGVAWKIQERAFGGLDSSTKRRLDRLADELEAKHDIKKPKLIQLRPGARLIREWRGQTHEVLVVTDGYIWTGKTYRSLTKIAKEITGTQWSGPRFFAIAAGGGA